MRKFAMEWPDVEIVQRTVAQILWRSNISLLDKLKESETRPVTKQQINEYRQTKQRIGVSWNAFILACY